MKKRFAGFKNRFRTLGDLAASVDILPIVLWLIGFGAIVFLAVMDYKVLFQMFYESGDTDLSKDFAISISVSLAALLEGFPTFFSLALSKAIDKSIVENSNEKRFAKLVSIASLIAGVVLFAIVIALRFLSILKRAGGAGIISAYVNGGEGMESFLSDAFQMVMPVFTSLMAFVISFTLMRTDALKSVTAKKNKQKKKTLRLAQESDLATNKLTSQKASFWNELQDKNGKPVPDDWIDFQRETQNLMDEAIVNDCMNNFERILIRFDKEMESWMNGTLSGLSVYSTTPLAIDQIDVAALLREFDGSKTDAKDRWDINAALPILEKMLLDELRKNPTEWYAEQKKKTRPPEPQPEPQPEPDPQQKPQPEPEPEPAPDMIIKRRDRVNRNP